MPSKNDMEIIVQDNGFMYMGPRYRRRRARLIKILDWAQFESQDWYAFDKAWKNLDRYENYLKIKRDEFIPVMNKILELRGQPRYY